MATHEHSIEIDVPVMVAYDQWTQFEDFPRFMEGVEAVEQVTDGLTRWRVEIAGVTREFEAKIAEQHPGERIAWASTDGTSHAGVVTFHELSPERCKIMLQVDVDPEGFAEKAGEALGIVSRRVKGDLERFATFIEERRLPTGGWRGDIPR
jgi:uncharacterized membrane protein